MVHEKKRGFELCDGYAELANAIIIQAVKDYRKALKADVRGRKREVERFMRSEWYKMLTNVDGEILIKKLRAEVHNL